jgi:hypothetical protein
VITFQHCIILLWLLWTRVAVNDELPRIHEQVYYGHVHSRIEVATRSCHSSWLQIYLIFWMASKNFWHLWLFMIITSLGSMQRRILSSNHIYMMIMSFMIVIYVNFFIDYGWCVGWTMTLCFYSYKFWGFFVEISYASVNLFDGCNLVIFLLD